MTHGELREAVVAEMLDNPGRYAPSIPGCQTESMELKHEVYKRYVADKVAKIGMYIPTRSGPR